MNIIWHGHSCFEITGKDGTIVFDPYQANSVPGLNSLKLKANLVLCSHEHDDHNARNCVEVAPKDFKVTCIETYHDHHQGSHRGKNTIHIVDFEDVFNHVLLYQCIITVMNLVMMYYQPMKNLFNNHLLLLMLMIVWKLIRILKHKQLYLKNQGINFPWFLL